MRRVLLESPYAGDTEANVEYGRKALRDSLLRGEAPMASHLLYTLPGVLSDEVDPERRRGIEAGLSWESAAEATVCYIDRGISKGMLIGIDRAERCGRPIEYRSLRYGDLGHVHVRRMIEQAREQFGHGDVLDFRRHTEQPPYYDGPCALEKE